MLYLIPNVLTTMSIFFGFWSLTACLHGDLPTAVAAVLLALLSDGLDGRLARMTGTQSIFGQELDSLADMVAFGAAPGLIAYTFHLAPYGHAGVGLAFFYVAMTGFRLARFNSQIQNTDKRFFKGLPCPSAAVLVVGSVYCAPQAGGWSSLWVAFMTAAAGFLMVSRVPYPSFKDNPFTTRQKFLGGLLGVPLVVLMTLRPIEVVFITVASYALWGFCRWCWHHSKRWLHLHRAG